MTLQSEAQGNIHLNGIFNSFLQTNAGTKALKPLHPQIISKNLLLIHPSGPSQAEVPYSRFKSFELVNSTQVESEAIQLHIITFPASSAKLPPFQAPSTPSQAGANLRSEPLGRVALIVLTLRGASVAEVHFRYYPEVCQRSPRN